MAARCAAAAGEAAAAAGMTVPFFNPAASLAGGPHAWSPSMATNARPMTYEQQGDEVVPLHDDDPGICPQEQDVRQVFRLYQQKKKC